jgi:hypothetical protein
LELSFGCWVVGYKDPCLVLIKTVFVAFAAQMVTGVSATAILANNPDRVVNA